MTKLTDDAEKIAAETLVTSEGHASLALALVAALSDLTVVHAGSEADLGTYSYKYAALPDVVKLTRPVLARHGLVALTPVHDHGQGLACTVTFLHTSGDRLDLGPFPFPHGRDAQATGSWVTYIRRYALIAALGMATGEDDDGATAKAREPEQPAAWNAGMAKAHLLNLAEGDKELAAAAWAHMKGDEWPEWTASGIESEFMEYMTPIEDGAS